jgi:PST family polysaccharide transporter
MDVTTQRSLRSNILSLGALQAFNFLLTLCILPYLTRVFGVAGWGEVVFVQMIINYLIWATNWGFYWGGTKDIAQNRNHAQIYRNTFWVIWGAQWLLTLAAFFVLLLAFIFWPMSSHERNLYIAGAGLILGGTLTPLWYFNGLEKIREAALLQILAKVLALPLILLFVEQETDLALYLSINSFCAIVAGLVALRWLYRAGELTWYYPSLSEMKAVIYREFAWFRSSMVANLNSSLAPLLLGMLAGPAELGLYNLADRLRLATVTALNPIIHAAFPRMSYLFSNHHSDALVLLKKIALGILSLSIFACLPLFFFPVEILGLMGGKNFESAKSMLLWLAWVPIFSIAISFFLYQILIPRDATKIYNRGILATLLISSILVYPFERYYGGNGAAALVFISELFTAVYLGYYIYKQKLLQKVESS